MGFQNGVGENEIAHAAGSPRRSGFLIGPAVQFLKIDPLASGIDDNHRPVFFRTGRVRAARFLRGFRSGKQALLLVSLDADDLVHASNIG